MATKSPSSTSPMVLRKSHSGSPRMFMGIQFGMERSLSKSQLTAIPAAIPVFGSPLTAVVDKDQSEGSKEQVVPFLVEECIQYLNRDDILKSEGLFRQSGKTSDIQEIKTLYEKGKYVTLMGYEDPNAVTGVLKSYIRELPDPLLTYSAYKTFINFMKATPTIDQDSLENLRQILQTLPTANKIFLKLLLSLLYKTSQFEYANKMSKANLAIVIAPNILKNKDETMMSVMEDSHCVNSLVEYLIEYSYYLFSGDASTDAYSLEWIAEKRQRHPPVYPTFTEIQEKAEEKKKTINFLSSWLSRRLRKEDLVTRKILNE